MTEPPSSIWNASLTALSRCTARAQDYLQRMGIQAVGDLLHHYPFRWVDRRQVVPLRSLARLYQEDPEQYFTVMGQVKKVEGVKSRQGRFSRRHSFKDRVQVVLEEEGATVPLVFFGGLWREKEFVPGMPVLVSGVLTSFRGQYQFVNPEYEPLVQETEAAFHSGRLFPVYPLTKGITQKQMRIWTRQALAWLGREPAETLPASVRKEFELQDLHAALSAFHFPRSAEERDSARHRLAFEEVFLDQLFMGAIRRRREAGRQGDVFLTDGELLRRVRAGLPFDLTGDQISSLDEILQDLASGRPMNRLLQGDVGSGKTVVALLAAVAGADSGFQSAFMVPTEILAEQHFRTLLDLAGPFGLNPELLTGSVTGKRRAAVLASLANGTCRLVVGTHALIQKSVAFDRLALVVMDEQHRFGVLQRLALWEKGNTPHVLVMSATPIPRSLALVRYGDLDVSIIRERPKGRGEVVSRVTTESKREAVYGFMAERLQEGRQAFIIYPLVEESEKSELKAATTMAESLATREDLKAHGVGLVHGQMKSDEKEAVMQRFRRGDIGVLVATTVIEVGIDIPNASFMLIEHPERYGLSQLHQLRGRIGRGEHKSYCVLLVDERVPEPVRDRLQTFAATDDGFELARLDLQLRGQGEVAGTRQHGRPGYKLIDPVADEAIILQARDRAQAALEEGALDGQKGPEWEDLRLRIRALLEASGSLVEVG